MRLIYKLMAIALTTVAVSSCRTPKNITYLQGFDNGDTMNVAPAKDITAEPGDRLSIIVNAKDPVLAQPFNLVGPTRQNSSYLQGVSNEMANRTTGSQNSLPYFVDSFGDITFPLLGTLHVEGMNRFEIARMIEKEIKDRNYIKDPTVSVEFLDHSLTFLGAVSRPGRVVFDRDRLTLLEGIAMAGDLKLSGLRTNVRVIRMEDGREHAYEVDLTDPKSVYSSPVFYLQPNDLIYVESNNMEKRTTTPTGNSAFTPAFWMSLASFVMSTALFIVKW